MSKAVSCSTPVSAPISPTPTEYAQICSHSCIRRLTLKEEVHRKYPLMNMYTFTATIQKLSNSHAAVSAFETAAPVRSDSMPPFPR